MKNEGNKTITITVNKYTVIVLGAIIGLLLFSNVVLVTMHRSIKNNYDENIALHNLLNHRKIIADEQRAALNNSISEISIKVAEMNERLVTIMETEIKQMKRDISKNSAEINALKTVIAREGKGSTFIIQRNDPVHIENK